MAYKRWTALTWLAAAAFAVLALLPAYSDAAAWLPQRTVGTGEDNGHALAVAPDGQATVVWSTADAFPVNVNTIRVMYARVKSSGTIGTPQVLSVDRQWAVHQRAVVAPDGKVTVTWEADVNGDWIIKSRQIAADGTLGPESSLSAPGRDGSWHWAGAAADGSVTVAWIETTGATGDGEAKAVRIAPDGTVGAPVSLSPAGTDVDSLRVGVAPDGTATVVWRTHADDLESVRIAPDGTPGPVVGLATGVTPSQGFVDVADDGAATVAWQAATPARLDAVKALRIAPNGVVGPTHTLAASGAWGLPVVAVAPGGAATVVWDQPGANAGNPDEVESVRFTPNGTPGPVQTVSPASHDAWHANLASGPSGATIVVWDDRGSNDMLATEIAADGTIGATTTIFTDPTWFSSQGIVGFDGAGNATVIAMAEHLADNRFDLAYFDVQPPTFKKLQIPASGHPGMPLSFAASATDNRSGVSSIKWWFGDGTTAVGAAPTHVYARRGTYLVKVTATDGAGNATSKTQVIVVT